MTSSAPGGGAKLALIVLGLAMLGVWLLAPNFFRGSGAGVCGLSLKYGPAFEDVTVQRVDRRDEPRPVAVGKPLAVPCGEALEVSWNRAPSAAPAASVKGLPARGVQRVPAASLKPGSVVQVELR